MKLIVKYLLSESYRKQQFANATICPKKQEHTIELPPTVPVGLLSKAKINDVGDEAVLDLTVAYSSELPSRNRIREETRHIVIVKNGYSNYRDYKVRCVTEQSVPREYDAPLSLQALIDVFADQVLGEDDIAWNNQQREACQAAVAQEKADDEAHRDKEVASKREKQEAEERAQKVVDDFRAAWITEHGTPSQKARDEEGLLGDEEIDEAIKSSAFANVRANQYEKLDRSDIAHDEDCCDNTGKTTFDRSVADAATAQEYESLCLIRAQLSATQSAMLYTHTAKCYDCDQTATRTSIKVFARLGPLQFSKSFAV